MIGVIMLILAAAGVAKFLSGGDSDGGTDLQDRYASRLRDSPHFGTLTSSGTYPRSYRFDKETGRLEDD